MSDTVSGEFRISLSIISLAIITVGLLTTSYLVRNNQDIRKKAVISTSLTVRVSKNFVLPGESYNLYVFDQKSPQHGYTGQLEVQTGTYTGIWKDFSGNPVQVNNGVAVINVPSGTASFTTPSARFRPYPNTYGFDWSNDISQAVGTTTGLTYMANYYKMPTSNILFEGKNYTYSTPVSFKTVIGFEGASNLCSLGSGQVMYFIKDKPEGYWGPSYSWTGIQSSHKRNLRWPLVNFTQKSGWYDNYLTAS